MCLFPEYVQDHWQEDELFAHQFLNGVNPLLIQRCSALPANLPVTSSMVFPGGDFTLDDELKVTTDGMFFDFIRVNYFYLTDCLLSTQNGNIFLCDYKLLDGVETNTINGKEQYLTAPLALLHQTPDKRLKPIAIQVRP